MKKLSVLFIQTLLLWFALLGATQLASAASDTWVGNTDANWSNNLNWSPAATPVFGDSLIFGAAGSSGATLNNDLTAGTGFSGLTFSSGGSAFTLNGHSILLGGSISNTIAILNSSGQPQVVGMPLTLDLGYFTFSSPVAGGSVALNGGLTLNTGGVAYFDTHVTSTSLALDATTGLISGLEGAGLMYNSVSTPTGLATISSGNIVAYSGYTAVAPGAIVNGNNLNLTATGAANYTANNNTVNTISSASIGNSGGTATTVLTTTGTLTLGANGGVYLLGNTLGNKTCLNLTGGTITAGTAGPATIVFAVNGNNANNQLSVNSRLADNAGPGAVTVVTTGPGSLNFATSTLNNYSGGTYITEGQLQWGQPTGLGFGPVYVATNASAYYTGTATFTNDLYLSPGPGSPTAAATANGGALIYGGNGVTFSGTIHLLGPPVTTAPGNRISTTATSQTLTFSGPITGTGTLELYQGGHSGNTVLANAAQNNNWTGGILIAPKSGLSAYFKLGANNQIPNGPGTGDIMIINNTSGQNSRFDLNGFSATINALNSSSGGTLSAQQLDNFGSAAGTLTMGASGVNGTFYGVMSDSAADYIALVKIGSGTQTFSGTAAFGYHGNTTVNQGTFALAGAGQIPNSLFITVASGATLDVSALTGGLTVSSAQTLNCVGTIKGDTTINGTVKALDSIGTLTGTGTGNMTINGGGTYVWDVNDTTGTQGADPGWSWLNIAGTLTINSSDGSPFNINVTSLNGSDVAGNAAHFNYGTSQSWIIATAAGGITGFTDSGQFNVVTTGFQNFPGSPSQWSVTQNANSLVLNFTASQVITTPITPTETVNQGQNASFTVTANPAGTGGWTFAWTQNGNALANGGTSAGGNAGNVTISTVGNTSTLTINGVDNAGPGLDGGTIAVTVTTTLNSSLQSATSSGALTVVDIPYNPNVVQSQNVTPVNAGAVNILTASASGTQPFTYQWYLNGNAINGATGSTFAVNISPGTAGSYTVVISNPAGSVTSSTTVITPVSLVPNQIIFDPFYYPVQSHPNSGWSALGVTNVFNQATGAGLAWLKTGNVDFSTLLASGQQIDLPYSSVGGLVDPYTTAVIGSRNLATDEYPVAGLAGNEPNTIYADSDVNAGQVNLPFGTAITSGTVYFSFVVQLIGFNTSAAATDYLCGLGSGAANSTTHSVGLYVYEPSPPNTWPNIAYTMGVFKGNLTTSQLNPGVNGNWVPYTTYPPGYDSAFLDYNVLFVVGRLNLNAASPGYSTVDLWVNPPSSSFYADEANVPTPDVAGAAGAVADDWSGGVSLFNVKITTYPVDRDFADVRIGTTWASVTPPSAPALSLANQILTNPVSSTVVFASQNAGNPVSGNYQWTFNNGSGPVTLSDTTLGDGAVVSGSATATLTIAGATAAEVGTYTVTGSNTDPSPSGGGATLTGSASALLTTTRPALTISSSPPNVVLAWPTNWPVVLEATTSLAPPITWTPAPSGDSGFLYWPPGSGALAWAPPSTTVSGANYTATVASESASELFFRLAPSP